MGGDILRVIAEQGPWALLAGFAVLAARSRPWKEVGRVAAKEIRWRYLRAKGYSKKDLRRSILDDWDEDPPEVEPKASADG